MLGLSIGVLLWVVSIVLAYNAGRVYTAIKYLTKEGIKNEAKNRPTWVEKKTVGTSGKGTSTECEAGGEITPRKGSSK